MGSTPEQAGRDDDGAGQSSGARSSFSATNEIASQQAARQQVRRPDRSEKVIRYIECLTIPSGVGQGQPFKLREWQKQVIRDVYEPPDPATSLRLVQSGRLPGEKERQNGTDCGAGPGSSSRP